MSQSPRAPDDLRADAPRRLLPVVAPLADRFARSIRYLRISLTDRCNYRCTYCMPAEGVVLLPREEILSFEELERLVGVFSELGVRRVRLTGGEPTIRAHVEDLVRRLTTVPGIDEVVMTTNGHRLPELAAALAAAGIAELNVSVDTLDAAKFAAITRRGELARVLDGIAAAQAHGIPVKINAVALRGFSEDELTNLCRWSWERGIVPRFIEHMPMSDGQLYDPAAQLAAADIRARIEADLGEPLVADQPPAAAAAPRGPARYWRAGGDPRREVGIISAMTEHFCDTCNRVRLSAVGDLHTCLAYDDATSLRTILRAGGTDDDLRAAIHAAVVGKREGHSFTTTGAGAPRKHMVSIGG